MKSSRATTSSRDTVNELDIDPDIYNEIGDAYSSSLTSEESDLTETNNKKSFNPPVTQNATTDVSTAADGESSCILRNLSFFEVFDGETGEFIHLDDITQLRKSKGKKYV
jgi:hypothetical protein